MGVGNNFILALILLFLVALFCGSPNMDPVIRELTPDYPMEEAGLQVGDKILSINGGKTKTSEDIQVRLSLVKEGSDITFHPHFISDCACSFTAGCSIELMRTVPFDGFARSDKRGI